MRKPFILILCLILVAALALCVSAEELQAAADISDATEFSGSGYYKFGFLSDKNIKDYRQSDGNAVIVLDNPEGMASLYLLFDLEYGEYTIKDNNTGTVITAGTYDFLHEFIDLEAGFGYCPTSLTLDFANGAVTLSEIYVFSSGQTPDFVQKWEPPLDGKADMLVMPTHGDDDQIFFAGLFPYYAGELDCAVQVAYLTNHRSLTNERIHEMIDGLWATGVENYPVFAYKWDFLTYGYVLKNAYQTYADYGISKEDLVGFAVEQFRRFKPQVVVGHDIMGEYGHPMHRIYSEMIMAAAEISADPESYPESAQEYGVWDVPKVYLHLLEDNAIEINYDTPLDHFDGLTAFEATQKYGFPCHVTQQYPIHYWMTHMGFKDESTKASELTQYSPCKFGLYRSTIGEDVLKNDFLENIVTYEEQARLEQERLEQERLEQERLEQERLEQERLEQERLEQERLAKLEQERLEKERLEQERLEQERLELEEMERLIAEARRRESVTFICLAVVCFAGSSLAFRFTKKHLEKKKGLYQNRKIKK